MTNMKLILVLFINQNIFVTLQPPETYKTRVFPASHETKGFFKEKYLTFKICLCEQELHVCVFAPLEPSSLTQYEY